ncbi:MAG: thioredoxin family protein [Acetobacteraceae bacterium]|nr:thioredoxin family protein [Acetobacteraceae bacterium]
MRLARMLSIAVIGTCLSLSATQPSWAATVVPFTQEAFAASEQAGKPILLHVSAPWCPTCARQRPILDHLAAEPAFKDLIIYKVDFDHQKDVLRAMGVRMQSTLIAFHGKTEEGRSTGDTDPKSIRALVQKSLG